MKIWPWMDYNGILSIDLYFMIKSLIWLPGSLVFIWNDRSTFQWSSQISLFTSFSSEVIAAVRKPFSLQERTKFILMPMSAQLPQRWWHCCGRMGKSPSVLMKHGAWQDSEAWNLPSCYLFTSYSGTNHCLVCLNTIWSQLWTHFINRTQIFCKANF